MTFISLSAPERGKGVVYRPDVGTTLACGCVADPGAAAYNRRAADKCFGRFFGSLRVQGRREREPMRRLFMHFSFVVAGFVLLAATVRADVQPGDTITKAELDKVKDLTSPGVQWCLEHGMTIKIKAPRDIKLPK